MELSKQCCTLQQSKRLKELGVKQESYFYWMDGLQSYKEIISTLQDLMKDEIIEHNRDERGVSDVHINLGELNERATAMFEESKVTIAEEVQIFSAFTVAELGELLPFYLVNIGELTVKKNYRRVRKTGWNCQYQKTINCNGEPLPVFCAKTQAESLALMLIHLLESSLITAEQVNEKL